MRDATWVWFLSRLLEAGLLVAVVGSLAALGAVHPWAYVPLWFLAGVCALLTLLRTLLVLPPDEAAREAIFRSDLAERPIAGIDLARLARATGGYSGADIAHVCETAAEKALIESARDGEVRLIEMRHVDAALAEVRPSLAGWFEAARNGKIAPPMTMAVTRNLPRLNGRPSSVKL